MSCAVIRSRDPAFRTLPSSTVRTPSFSPTARRSSCFPLNAKHDVRAATRRPPCCTRTLMISSVIPSAKYSSSATGLMLANGRTAIDGAAGASDRLLAR